MIENLKVFVVHYSKLRYRRRYLEKELKKYGFDYEFVTKYDKEDLDENLIKKIYLDDKDFYENKTSSMWDKISGSYRKLSLGEISCAAKHFECIRLASLEEKPSLIIEDDCIFSDNFKDDLTEIVEEIRREGVEWDAVFLGLGCGKRFQDQYLFNNSVRVSQKLFKINHPATNCAECYLIKNNCSDQIVKNCYPFSLTQDRDWETLTELLNKY